MHTCIVLQARRSYRKCWKLVSDTHIPGKSKKETKIPSVKVKSTILEDESNTLHSVSYRIAFV
jgi:hypothetical protein